MSDDIARHEQRRYSALCMVGVTIDGLLEATDRLLIDVKPFEPGEVPSEWEIFTAEALADSNLYPSHRVDPTEIRTRDGYRHRIVVGEARLPIGDKEQDCLLLSVPYTSLLWDVVHSASIPKARYCSIEMDRLYQWFTRHEGHGMRAGRISVQMDADTGVEMVSLIGRHPLRSDLRQAIRRVASPYAIRLDVEDLQGRVRLNADRHGNLHWYLTELGRISAPLRGLSEIARSEALIETTSVPLSLKGKA